MGNPIIYIVIGVLLVAIIAWFFINSKKKSAEPEKPRPVANPVPRHLQEESSEPVPTSVPERDYINNAQGFINQQRYQEAENELKTGLKKDASNDSLMLKLLNVYALTSNHNAFNSLYNDFQIHASDSNLQQANDLKSMLAEEGDLQEAARKAPPSETVDNAPLEFNLNDEFDDTAEGAASEESLEPEEPMSFDDLESQLLDDSPKPTVADATPVASNEFDFSNEIDSDSFGSFDDVDTDAKSMFDISLDEDITETPTSSTETLEIAPKETSSDTQDSLDSASFDDAFDLSTNEESLDSVPGTTTLSQSSVEQTSLDNDFDFSFDDMDSDDSVPNEDAITKEFSIDALDSNTNDNSLSLDDSDFDDTMTSEPQQDVSSDLADFEFDLEDKVSSESISTGTDVNTDTIVDATEDSETTVDWDSALPEADTEIKPVLDNSITIAPDVNAISHTIDNNVAVSELDDTFAQLDAMSQSEQLGVLSDTPVNSNVDTIDADAFDFNDDATDTGSDISPTDTSITPDLTEAPTSDFIADEPVEEVQEVTPDSITPAESVTSVKDNEFAEAFGFVQELDNSQITLDLAGQYLELGEYESAKRLVDEVLQSNVSDAQKRTAQDILARMD